MDIPGDVPFRYQPTPYQADLASGVCILLISSLPARICELREVLTAPERTFECVPTLAHATSALERHHFDLVLTDYTLDDGTAAHLIDWLTRKTRSEAVIITSATETLETAFQALRPGLDDWLPSTCPQLQLAQAVDGTLQRIMLERANIEMAQRLRASQRLHRYLVESSPDLIFTLDTDNSFTYLNPRGEAILGYPRTSLLQQPLLSIVHPDDRRHVDQQLRMQRARPESHFDLELRLTGQDRRRHNGKPNVPISVSLHGIPMVRTMDGRDTYTGLYCIVRDISEHKRAEAIISFQTYHDQLTRLPNRRLFLERLQQRLAPSVRLAVLVIDVDRFKLVNDSYGHAAGDTLLQAIASRLSGALRTGDTLARLGGDEFAALLPDAKTPQHAEATAHKILRSLETPFSLGSGEFRVTASIGIAFHPNDGADVDTLTRHADIAMHQVKRSGKNGFRFFAPELNTHHHSRLTLENDLRKAIVRNELELHYQPQVSLAERRVVGVEALIRWRHPIDGLLAPDTFISIAEETGQISDISHWVINQACAQLAQWRQKGHESLRMSVNLAPHDLEREEILPLIIDNLAQHQLPGDRLELEITESMMVRDTSSVARTLRMLRKHGIGIGIDDFGTGYSALAYLQQLPVNLLKIDRSFVSEMGTPINNPIISAITGIARGFGLKLIAEGVESAEQACALRGVGCDVMQGFYFSRPLPAPDVEIMLNQPPATLRSIAR